MLDWARPQPAPRMIWSDAQVLSALAVVACHVVLAFAANPLIAAFMGKVTATGGRIGDVPTNTMLMILCGQPYARAVLLGAGINAMMDEL